MRMDRVIVRASNVWVEEERGKYLTDLVELQRGERKLYLIRDVRKQTRFVMINNEEYDLARKKLDRTNAMPLPLESPDEFLQAMDDNNYEEASRLLSGFVRFIEEEGLKGQDN
jgi:hypothetical protein